MKSQKEHTKPMKEESGNDANRAASNTAKRTWISPEIREEDFRGTEDLPPALPAAPAQNGS